jgi:hypothetical protein
MRGRRSGWWALAFLTVVAAGPSRASAAEASPGVSAPDPGGVVELAALAGVGGPVGPTGLAISVVPLPRLSIGIAMGQFLVGNSSDSPRAFRAALVLRFYPIELPRLRVAIGAWASDGAGGDDWSGRIVTAPDGTPLSDQWSWSHGRRLDGTIAVEGVHGNAILRLEGGAGRLAAETRCSVTATSGSCDRVGFQPEHSEWRGFVQLAVAVRPGRWPATVGVAASADTTEPASAVGAAPSQLRVSLAIVPIRRSLLLHDGDVADPVAFEGGVNADYLRSAGSRLRLGLGARYEYGGGSEKPVLPFSRYQSEHIGFLPVLVGVGRRLRGTDEQIEGLVGFGPALGSFSVRRYTAFGLGGEIDFNYVRPLGTAVALVVGVSARLISFSAKIDDGGQIGTSGVHVELPVNLGLRMLL